MPEPIHTRLLAPRGVVRRQPGMTFLGRIQRRDLPGQVVVRTGRGQCILIVTPARWGTCRPSGRADPSSVPRASGVLGRIESVKSAGVREQVEIVVMTARLVGSGLRP